MRRKIIFIGATAAVAISAGLVWTGIFRRNDLPSSLEKDPERTGSASVVSLSSQVAPSSALASPLGKLLESAVKSGDRKQWGPLLLRLLNPSYPRTEAISLLKVYLGHDDVELRIAAARYLFELGSKDGYDTLIEVLKMGGLNDAVSGLQIYSAAKILHQYGQEIPANLLVKAYSKHPTADLLEILALEQVPEAAQIIRSNLGKDSESTVLAGYLKIDDASSLSVFNRDLENKSPVRRLDANWALFRATGKQQYLDYIISVAKEGVGVLPKSSATGEWTKENALKYLALSRTPESTAALEEIVEFSAKSGDASSFNEALGSLFYIHNDFDFIDKKISQQIDRGYSPLGGDIWKIASSRDNPTFSEAIRTKNSQIYDLYFSKLNGRPVEGWIFNSVPNVPREKPAPPSR